MLVDVRLCRQKPVVDRVRLERVTRRRVVGLDLLPFISVDIPSELDRSTPTSSTFVSGFEGGPEVFRVPMHRTNLAASTKGKRLTYSLLVE